MRNRLKHRTNELEGCGGTKAPVILPKLPNEAELATQSPRLFAQIIITKLQKVIEAQEDDSILSEHIERVMKTPTSKPTLLTLPTIKRVSLKSLQKRTKITFSSLSNSFCDDVDKKVHYTKDFDAHARRETFNIS